MGLLTPLGLLGLIGIPILIIIYIIKPKYHEKKISSTFIWKLSLKYRKKKIPLQWLQRSLLFFVQVLAIGLAALILARPLMEVDAKDGEKIVVTDNDGNSNNGIRYPLSEDFRSMKTLDMVSGDQDNVIKPWVSYYGYNFWGGDDYSLTQHE